MRIGPTTDPVGGVQEHRRDADREQEHRERPDDVHAAGEQRVEHPSEEACEQRDHRCEEAADDGRSDPDHERVAPAVEHPRGHVASVLIGAEEVVGRIPGGPDRRLAQMQKAAALLHHRHRLAVHDRVPVQVVLERVHVGDVARVERRREADHHDDDEHHRAGHGDPVAHEPAARERPRAATGHLRSPWGCRLDVLQGCDLSHPSPPYQPGAGGSWSRPPRMSASSRYLTQSWSIRMYHCGFHW